MYANYKQAFKNIAIITGGGLLVSGCAYVAPVDISSTPGFFIGFFHGLISFVTMVLSFFTDVKMYATPNTGSWYDLGFVFGVMCVYGGGAKGSRRRR